MNTQQHTEDNPRKHPSVRISNRKLEYVLMDRKNLHNRYYLKVMRGGSRFLLGRIKKNHMIKLLLEEEFGKKAIAEYEAEVKEWNACKWYVEHA